MATTYTPNAQLGQPAYNDAGWNTPLNANCSQLDGLSPVGALCVTTTEVPSSTLRIKVAAGSFITQSGAVQTYAGTAALTLSASTTVVLYLDGTNSWALTSASSYPATAHACAWRASQRGRARFRRSRTIASRSASPARSPTGRSGRWVRRTACRSARLARKRSGSSARRQPRNRRWDRRRRERRTR